MASEEGDCDCGPSRPKVVVVMGATGSGKSRLAIDLASYFPVEIINADSMQVYDGLDVLTNKVSVEDRRGVPHHMLGTIPANVDFTSKNFRDLAIPIIEDIVSRNCLPIVVGGTNYYIQALVSPFLLDESIEDTEDTTGDDSVEEMLQDFSFDHCADTIAGYDLLKKLDPVAANRIHPNDHRKINHYLRLCANQGILPSKLFQGKASQNWGQANNLRYACCFIWLDASLSVLDRFVEERVDVMMRSGLLEEVYDIYRPNGDYSRGLLQAIGVREFKKFLSYHCSRSEACDCPHYEENGDISNYGARSPASTKMHDQMLKTELRAVLDSGETILKVHLAEAIEKMKMNTRKLVRRQRRRLSRLKTFFGWDLHHIDATEAFISNFGETWMNRVLDPCIAIINSFIDNGEGSKKICNSQMSAPRDLWTQYVCEACGNRVLRGAHEWEQHKQGRSHRKRVCSLRRNRAKVDPKIGTTLTGAE